MLRSTLHFLMCCMVILVLATPTLRAEPAAKAIDHRDVIESADFKASGDGEWLAPVKTPPFAFDELIYSWQIKIPDGEGFRLYFQVRCDDGSESPWLYGGFWGKVKPFDGKREEPKFEFGEVAMDQLLLTKKATTYQFKLVSEGDTPLTVIPKLHIITTDNKPTPELAEKFAPVYTAQAFEPKMLDLPLRKQQDSTGKDLEDEGRCQSAAVATAMQFFGKPLNLEEIIPLTNDPEYNYPGIWPRTIGAATQNGFTAYIDRFRDWDAVKATLAQNKVILVSMKMPKAEGKYIDPPYSSLGGHIVAFNGWTDDGRIVVTDSAIAANDEGYMCQWLREDFEKVWMDIKGGVGMVVCPPGDASIKLYTDPLPEMPKGRAAKRDAARAKREAEKTAAAAEKKG